MNALEGLLARALGERLGVSGAEIDLERPLFELGLAPVLLAEVLADVEDLHGSPLPDAPYGGEGVAALASRARTPPRPPARATPVAIVGMACRLPGADSPDALWEVLRAGATTAGEVPPERWDADALYDPELRELGKICSRHGGFVGEIDGFDASFFGIGPRDARAMDPQHRMVLELAWLALEDAGISAARLSEGSCGVYLGMSASDYALLVGRTFPRDIAGSALAACANRVSRMLNLHGPSFVVDSACSSAIVALDLACRALSDEACDSALVGAVHATLLPDLPAVLSLTGALSPDGSCRTFDSDAEGYVRSEGAGMFLLKRLDDALADGDRVQAIIRATAVNNDGGTASLAVPNPLAQRAVQRQALRRAGVAARDVGYVEAHGTATRVGDPLEVRALGSVFRRADFGSRPCYLGSVKANVGHLEPAAGVASLLKAVLVLRTGLIPGQPGLENVNPELQIERTPFAIATELTPWPAQDGPRIAGLNSFGVGGTNAHVVLEQPPAPPRADVLRPGPHVLAVSARTEPALHRLVSAYADALTADDAPDLAEVCATAGSGRTHFAQRIAVVADDVPAAAARLRAAMAGDRSPQIRRTAADRDGRAVALLFAGQGSAFAGMGHALLGAEPVFTETIEQCERLLGDALGSPLREVLWPADAARWRLPEDAALQAALFSFELAAARMWLARGVRPRALLGHSLGEYVAAHLAGCVDLEDALELLVVRGEIQRDVAARRPGAMAALLTDRKTATGLLAHGRDLVSIAAVNGPTTVVVSGGRDEVEAVVAAAEHVGILARDVPSAAPMHSPLFDAEVLAGFARAARRVSFRAPRIPLVSNLTGAVLTEAPDAEYWSRHMRETVDFAGGLRTVRDSGCELFLEVGPGSTLSSLVRRTVGRTGGRGIAALPAGEDPWRSGADVLAELYVAGVDVRWDAVYAGRSPRRVPLPGYPFERRRFWIEPRPARQPAHG